MLNDVHAPPPEPGNDASSPASTRRAPPPHHPAHGDRAHSLEKTSDHHGGTNLVFSDPEDRADSFNTTMSAIIVAGVLVVLGVIAWMFLH